MNYKSSILLAITLVGSTARATNYYVATGGSDANNGTSTTTPWATISKVNSQTLAPGDTVKFSCGNSFSGTLTLSQSGTSAAPVTIDSYGCDSASGIGFPVIQAGSGSGISATDVQYITVQNLVVAGLGVWSTTGTFSGNTGSGVVFTNDLANNAQLSGITLNHVEAHHFGGYGLVFNGTNASDGFSTVVVSNSQFHDNVVGGAAFLSAQNSPPTTAWSHNNVTITQSNFYNNAGQTSLASESAYGLFMQSANVVLVDTCTLSNNGQFAPTSVMAAGATFFNVKGLTLQNSVASLNGSPLQGAYGVGFRLDGGLDTAIVQWNTTFFNGAAGIYVTTRAGAATARNSIIRFNMLSSDAQGDASQGGFHMDTNLHSGLYFINNTIFFPHASAVGYPGALEITNGVTNMTVENNIFYAPSDTPVVRIAAGTGALTTLVMDYNNLWPGYFTFIGYWNGVKVSSFATWKSTTALEVHGLSANPRVYPLAATTTGLLSQPNSNSAARGAAITLPQQGAADYWQTLVPTSGMTDMGATLYASQADVAPPSGGATDFTGNAYDSIRLLLSAPVTGMTAAVTSGQLQVTGAANTTTNSYMGIRGREPFNLVENTFLVQVKQTLTGANASTQFSMNLDDNDELRIVADNGFLYFRKVLGGTMTGVASAPYNATSMAWWRFRETAGSVYAEYSPTAAGPWTTLAGILDPFSLQEVYAMVRAGTFGSNPAPGTALIDNVNVDASASYDFSFQGPSDLLNGTAIDATLWTASLPAGGAATEASGTLNLSLPASYNGTTPAAVQSAVAPLYGNGILVKAVSIPPAASGTVARLESRLDANNDLNLSVDSTTGALTFRKTVAGTQSVLGSVPYNASTMQWWRIYEESGTVYSDCSAYSTGPWTTIGSGADPAFDLSNVTVGVEVRAGPSGTSASPGTAQFAFFNSP